MTDPIADFLTRIRNAVRAKHKSTDIPASNIKKAMAHILLEQKYINGYSLVEDSPQGTIRVYLKYDTDGKSIISGLERISKPGLRKYSGVDDIPRTMGGLGLMIVSTPNGLLTDAQARQQHVGGEVLCRIW